MKKRNQPIPPSDEQIESALRRALRAQAQDFDIKLHVSDADRKRLMESYSRLHSDAAARQERLRIKPLVSIDAAETKNVFAQAARRGSEITPEIMQRMKEDRQKAERNDPSKPTNGKR